MAIPFVVLHGKLDRATRVRLAVLSGTAFNDSARSGRPHECLHFNHMTKTSA